MSAPVMPVLWCDVETTGLDPDRCALLEVAIAVTDVDLRVLETASYTLPIYGSESWDREALHMHAKNGLIAECSDHSKQARGRRLAGRDAAERLVKDLASEVAAAGLPAPYLGGSSVQFDRRFLEHHQHWVKRHIHPYRNVDVTSVIKLVETWASEAWQGLAHVRSEHRAQDDIATTISSLRRCREVLSAGGAAGAGEIGEDAICAHLQRIGSSTWGRVFSISQEKDRKRAAGWLAKEIHQVTAGAVSSS